MMISRNFRILIIILLVVKKLLMMYLLFVVGFIGVLRCLKVFISFIFVVERSMDMNFIFWFIVLMFGIFCLMLMMFGFMFMICFFLLGVILLY